MRKQAELYPRKHRRISSCSIILYLITGFCSFSAGSSFANDGKLIGDLYEEVSDKTDVSTHDIVGVWLGNENTQLTLEHSQIAVSVTSTLPIEVCFSSTTVDGLYFSSGTLTARANNTGLLDIVPLQHSQHLKLLSGYKSNDFAPLARLGPDCLEDTSSTIVPVRYKNGGKNLYVAIQSRRAQQVSLKIKDAHSERKGTCDQITSVRRVSFDVVCTIKLTEYFQSGLYSLTIGRQSRVGPYRTDQINVAL